MLSARKSALAFCAASLACAASPAFAASVPSTRLVNCAPGTCILVTGYRDSAASEVRINGRAVAVTGKRNWQARLPVDTVRGWAAPWARTLEVTLHDPAKQSVSLANASLPIGLMGHTDLASLVVNVR